MVAMQHIFAAAGVLTVVIEPGDAKGWASQHKPLAEQVCSKHAVKVSNTSQVSGVKVSETSQAGALTCGPC
jgi:hypothetical protein